MSAAFFLTSLRLQRLYWKTLTVLKPEQAKEVLKLMTDCNHASSMQIPSALRGAWTHLFQGRAPKELRKESQLRENSIINEMSLDFVYFQESYHCLLNYCCFSDLGFLQTRQSQRVRDAERAARALRGKDGDSKLGFDGLQNAFEDIECDCHLYFSSCNHDLSLSLCSLSCYMGQWKWTQGGRIQSYFNRKQELEYDWLWKWGKVQNDSQILARISEGQSAHKDYRPKRVFRGVLL